MNWIEALQSDALFIKAINSELENRRKLWKNQVINNTQ